MPRLQQALNDTSIELVFDILLSSDVYNQLEHGTTFFKIRKYSYTDPEALVPFVKNIHGQIICLLPKKNFTYAPFSNSNVLADGTKLSTLYMQMHYNAAQYDAFTFVFVDDNCFILQKLFDTFQKNPQLIPNNCVLKLILFNAQGPTTVFNDQVETITGVGAINHAWQQDLLETRNNLPFHKIKLNEDTKISQLTNELIRLQNKNHCLSRYSPRYSLFKPISDDKKIADSTRISYNQHSNDRNMESH